MGRSRAGQLLGQIVIFVIGLVVVAAVLAYGYIVWNDILAKRCVVVGAQFGTDLAQAIDTNRQWGTSHPVTLSAPCQSVDVCFIDLPFIDSWATAGTQSGTAFQPFSFIGAGAVQPTSAQRSVMESSVRSGDLTNVFTIQQDGTVLPVQKFNSNPATIAVRNQNDSGRAVCYPAVGGQFTVRMEGRGGLVQVGTQ